MKQLHTMALAAGLGFFAPLCVAQGAVGGRAYQCSAKAIQALQDRGFLGETDWTKLMSKTPRRFTYDSASSILRWEGTDLAWQYRTVQEGSTSNDLVGLRTLQGSAAFVVDSLRIRTWKPNMPFMLIEGDQVTTGTCRKM